MGKLVKLQRKFLDTLKSKFTFYEKGSVTLFHADIRDVLPFLPDNSFSSIITDPPYGINYGFYDDSNSVFFEVEDELFRITKPSGHMVVWWSTKKLPEIFQLRRFTYKHMIIAEFRGTYSKTCLGDRCYAVVLVFEKGKGKTYQKTRDIIAADELPCIKGRVRQGDFKPTFAQGKLIQVFCPENGIVLDPFAGYGSLLLAGMHFNYRVVGVEKDETRFLTASAMLDMGGIPANLSIPDIEAKVSRKKSGVASCMPSLFEIGSMSP